MSIPEIVAHRGYTLHYPENTLIGIQAAIDAGAHYVEVDIQLSADKIPYLFHDHDLQRICQKPGALHEYDSTQLDEFRASDPERFTDRYLQISLCRLSQLVDLLITQPDIHAFIELKRSSLNYFGMNTVITSVIEQLQNVRKQCIIISYSLEALVTTKQSGWDRAGAVIDLWNEREHPIIRDLKPEYLFCDYAGLPATGQLDYQYGQLVVFEITSPSTAIDLHKRGVNFIETFACGELIQVLKA